MKEKETGKKPNEILAANIPAIAEGLEELWECFGDRTMGFAGEGDFDDQNSYLDDLARSWSALVNQLTANCEVAINNMIDIEDWGEMIVSLVDLADEINLYFGPFWNELSDEEMHRVLIRMDMNAQRLLEIFSSRGYIQTEFPFEPDDWE